MRTLFINSLKTGGMTLTQLAVGVLLSVIWARVLPPAEFGRFLFATIVCATAAALLNPSIYAAVNFYLSKGIYNTEQLWGLLLTLSLAIGGLAALVAGVILTLADPASVAGQSGLSYGLLAVSTLGTVIHANFSGMMFGSGRVNQHAIWNTGLSLVYLAGGTTMALLAPAPRWWHPTGVYALYQLCAALGLVLVLRPRRVEGWSRALASAVVCYGLAVYPGRLATFLNYRIDAYFIVTLLGSTAMAHYSIATSIGEMLWQLPAAISLVMLPGIARLDQDTAARRILNTSQIVVLAMISLGMLTAVAGPPLIGLVYGPTYAAAGAPLLALLPGIVTCATVKILDPFFQALRRPELPSRAALVGLGCNIIANSLLIPSWGLTGAALASTISYTAQALYLAWSWQQLAGRPWWRLFVPALALGD